jgi:hypothetical protein
VSEPASAPRIAIAVDIALPIERQVESVLQGLAR